MLQKLQKIVVFWTNMQTDSSNSLYQQLFLNKALLPIDSDFKANILGAVSIIEESFEDLDLDERDLMLNIIS